jgi:hypothetical protein
MQAGGWSAGGEAVTDEEMLKIHVVEFLKKTGTVNKVLVETFENNGPDMFVYFAMNVELAHLLHGGSSMNPDDLRMLTECAKKLAKDAVEQGRVHGTATMVQ